MRLHLLITAALLTPLAPATALADGLDPSVQALIASGALKLEPIETVRRISLPGPRDVTLLRVTVRPGVREPAHTHPGLEIVHVLSGEGAVELDGRDVPVRAGETVRVDEGRRKALAATGAEPLVVLAVLVLRSGRPPLTVVGGRR